MTARGHLRGHAITWDCLTEQWVYADNQEPTADTWHDRPCGHCGRRETPEGHDACLGTLPGVMNACCGHGQPAEAYVQYPSGQTVRGRDALTLIDRLRNHVSHDTPHAHPTQH